MTFYLKQIVKEAIETDFRVLIAIVNAFWNGYKNGPDRNGQTW